MIFPHCLWNYQNAGQGKKRIQSMLIASPECLKCTLIGTEEWFTIINGYQRLTIEQ